MTVLLIAATLALWGAAPAIASAGVDSPEASQVDDGGEPSCEDDGLELFNDNNQSQPEINVTWDDDAKGFCVESSKEISNVWVEFCSGTKHKHDNLDGKVYDHREDEEITRIWVKSGNNGQEDNQPPGAGEEFTNPHVECEPGDECSGPEDLEGEALETEANRLNWSSVEDAHAYHVYRAVENGSFQRIATLNATQYVDANVTVDITYHYFVTASIGQTETEGCVKIEVIAIPTFPSVFTAAAASLGGLALYGTYRYRSDD